MKIFLRKILLFVIPISLIFVFPAGVVFYGREYVSFRDAIEIQNSNHQSLFGPAYNSESFYPYKKYLVSVKEPKVIALGTSRVMEFRKEFFKEGVTFVNAGGAARSLQDIESFVGDLSGTSTNMVILSLDKEVMTADYSSKENKKQDNSYVLFFKIAISMSRRIYLDYASHKFSLDDLISVYRSNKNIGLAAILHGDGFRDDGSYRYGGAMDDEQRVVSVMKQIDVAANSLEKNEKSELDKKAKNLQMNIKALEKVLDMARNKGIVVVGIMTPYPTPIYKSLMEKDVSLQNVSQGLGAIFKKHDLPFFDLSFVQTFAGKDTQFVDTVHGTDAMYLDIMLYMSEKNKIFSDYVDIKTLKNMNKERADFLSF